MCSGVYNGTPLFELLHMIEIPKRIILVGNGGENWLMKYENKTPAGISF